jgi:hypothetical protein
LGDTWEYDGTDWVETTPTPSPLPRFIAALAYDPLREVVVLFGGGGAAGIGYNDTWEYDGTTWVETPPTLPPSPTPSARGTMLIYDQLRQRIVLFGGTDLSNWLADTWEYDGIRWRNVLANAPSGRGFNTFIYDSVRKRAMIFGGLGTAGFGLNETWTYWYQSSWPDEICNNGTDDDDDTLADCADPDCDGQVCVGGGTCTGGLCP